jgi:hypothetical protein
MLVMEKKARDYCGGSTLACDDHHPDNTKKNHVLVNYREPLDVNWVYSCHSLPGKLIITEPCKLVLCRIGQ